MKIELNGETYLYTDISTRNIESFIKSMEDGRVLKFITLNEDNTLKDFVLICSSIVYSVRPESLKSIVNEETVLQIIKLNVKDYSIVSIFGEEVIISVPFKDLLLDDVRYISEMIASGEELYFEEGNRYVE